MEKQSFWKRGEDYATKVSGELIEQIKAGVAPWQKPWKPGEQSTPENFSTGKKYSGGNSLYLMSRAIREGRGDNRWGTYNQILAAGGQVRKGERGTQVLFFTDRTARAAKDEQGKTLKDQDGKTIYEEAQRDKPICKQYTVFNVEPPRPIVVRVDEVGRAEAVAYEAMEAQADPLDPTTKYFLNRFIHDFYSRRRATVQENWSRSLCFLSTELANASFRAESRNVALLAAGAARDELQVDRVVLRIQANPQEPHSATADFDLVRMEMANEVGRETEWIALVCLHSGVFTWAQFCHYFGDAHRWKAGRFVQTLLDRKAAVESASSATGPPAGYDAAAPVAGFRSGASGHELAPRRAGEGCIF